MPCRCKVTYDRGELFEWRHCDASKCQRWGHDSEDTIMGMS